MNPLLIFIGGAIVGGLIGSSSDNNQQRPSLPAPRPRYNNYNIHNHNTYIQVNNHYHAPANHQAGYRKSGAKAVEEERFNYWLNLKKQTDSIAGEMRQLYSQAKAPGLTRGQRNAKHQQLAQLKQKRRELESQKRRAHDRWQESKDSYGVHDTYLLDP